MSEVIMWFNIIREYSVLCFTMFSMFVQQVKLKAVKHNLYHNKLLLMNIFLLKNIHVFFFIFVIFFTDLKWVGLRGKKGDIFTHIFRHIPTGLGKDTGTS